MTPATARTLIQLAIVGGVLVVTFGAGWAVNGWRLGTKVEALKAEHSAAAAAAATKAGEQLAEVVAERDALANKLDQVDHAGTNELKRLKDENETLRRRVAAGTVGLRVAGTCPAVNTPTTGTAQGGGMDSGAAPVLTATAEQDYFALRENITSGETKLTACQRSLVELTGQATK